MAILPKNSIMFSHTDLDGIGGGIIFKATLGSLSEVHYCNYDEVDEKIIKRLDELEKKAEKPFILIADLGIKPETAERLDRYTGEKRWLDHHRTNIELASKYDWATVDTEACGTLLVFNEFDNIPRKYLDFVLHVDDYDRWIHALPKSNDLNRLLSIYGIDRFEERFVFDERMEFNHTEVLLLELEDENIERYIERVEKGMIVRHLIGDKFFGIGFAEKYKSEVAHELMERKNLEAIVLIDVNTRSLSLRSRGEINVGEIAKRLGGGGHKNAAGVSFKYGFIEDFKTLKYPLFGLHTEMNNVLYEVSWKIQNTYEQIENEEISKLFKGQENEN